MPTVSPRALAAIPAAVVFVVVGVVLAVLLPPLIALPVALVAAAVAGLYVMRSAPNRVVRMLGAVPLEEAAEPRLESLVESICASHGITEPRLYTLASDAVDAAVIGSGDDIRLVVTRGALAGLDRLELEALVARELSLFGSGGHAATVLASVSGLLGPAGAVLRERLLDDRRLVRADVDGVKLTRYPPALASTFEKAGAVERISDHPPTRHLWMVGPQAEGQTVQPPLVERIDMLREL